MRRIIFLYFVCIIVVFVMTTGCFSPMDRGSGEVQKAESKTEEIANEISKIEEREKEENLPNPPQSQPPKKEVSQTISNLNIQSTLTPKMPTLSEVNNSANTSPLPSDIESPEIVEEKKEEKKSEEVSSEAVLSDTGTNVGQGSPPEEMAESEFSKVKVGMSYAEVVKILGEPDMLVTAQKESDTYIYLWRKTGGFLYCKFEKGIVTRRSGKFEGTIDAPPLTEELYFQVNPGMSMEEVNLLLKREGRKISGENGEDGIYLWTDNKSGTSFSAKFENGKLVRKSSFYSKPKVVTNIGTQESEGTEKPNVEQLTEGEMVQQEIASTVESKNTPQEKEMDKEQSIGFEPDENLDTTTSTQTTSVPKRVVAIGRRGSENIEKSEVERSEKEPIKKTRLPNFTYQLREGSYEIKIQNPLDVEVLVGIRSDKRGKNFSIPAGGVKSIKVPRGEYNIYYIRSDEPNRVIEGGSVNIDGLFVGDVEIHLIR